ncbi:methyltransferase [Rugamonas sp. FT82W]|uniref:Methyltransferase n=2 Tax=Duganella vulcania TaxID=2692166 RepID=A0A845G5Y4_9BURK|nr:methyltransferase [Duganella vulcania]
MLHEATGLTLSRSTVERAIKSRMEQTAAANQDVYLDRMTPDELTALVELVVVPESWFFRDPQAFQAAAEFVRARLAGDTNRMVRILSIPCAGGEEPYTMAMVLADAGVRRDGYIIDAYDISPGCVERAKSGVYNHNAFRSQDLAFRDRHFTPDGDDYRINDALRQKVRFKQGNLLEFDLETRTGYYDVIFCRNLLIYFDKQTTRMAIAKLQALLEGNGLLFAGYAEVPSFCQHGFTPFQYPQAFGLKKEPARPAPAIQAAPKAAPRTERRTQPPAPASNQPARLSPVPVPAPAAGATANTNLLAEARKLADLGQLKEAENKSRDHLAQTPDSAEAYFILGLVNELTDKRKLAEDYWKRCVYLQPDHYEALCHLALLAETNKDPGAAAALKARAARVYKRQQGS